MKKWIFYYISGSFLGLLIIFGINFFSDPFGIFGDKIFDWYGYNMTMNPRIAKIGYLDKNHAKYNSYILGSSKTSSISPKQLNKYFDDANFYNMMVYGADLKHIELMTKYLIDNYEVKNIIINLGISELITYDNKSDDTKEMLHGKVNNNGFNFYKKFLTLNPNYSIDKLNAFMSENFKEKPSAYDVFLPEEGVYNKIKRDSENILNINDYVKEIGGNMFLMNPKFNETDIADNCINSIKEIKNYCTQNNINFMLISSPNYELELKSFDLLKVKDYFIKLSEVTDFWNFSGYNSISQDPRFFYDSVHFRNFIGEMMIGKIFNDPEIYYPDNFGEYMTKENSEKLSEKILTPNEDLTGYVDLNSENEMTSLPILMYHHIVPDGEQLNLATISVSKFKEDMQTFKDAGFNTIFLEEALAYCKGEIESLPPKPLVITFDDGYESNYLYAYPILKELNLKANINLIGWSFGRDTFLDSDKKITPHFGYGDANIMKDIIRYGSHSYDLHWDDENHERNGVLKKENETTKQYYDALKYDNEQFLKTVNFIDDLKVFCYPFGKADILSDFIYKELGYESTLLIENKVSKIAKGKPYTMYGLYRINAAFDIPSEELLKMISSE